MEFSMNSLVRSVVALGFGVTALGMTAASADHRDDDEASVSLSITVGDDYDGRSYGGRYDDDRYDRRHRGDRYDGRRGGSRVVKRRTYDTRYRARIVLVEEVYYSRRGSYLVCTVDVRGRDARYVSNRQVRAIARAGCSHRARIRYS
jgi:hypothetical protein